MFWGSLGNGSSLLPKKQYFLVPFEGKKDLKPQKKNVVPPFNDQLREFVAAGHEDRMEAEVESGRDNRDNKTGRLLRYLLLFQAFSPRNPAMLTVNARSLAVSRFCLEDSVPVLVKHNVFIGSIGSVKNPSALKQLGITHVLVLCSEKVPA
mmetsp:Transcript_3776/g.13617  ORF Transcript_3776/g.13617 Transcript_3776/m.13617 type:complete len:151 (-) Transcript_3776:1417-1869(-)